jgi:hypothetical protein
MLPLTVAAGTLGGNPFGQGGITICAGLGAGVTSEAILLLFSVAVFPQPELVRVMKATVSSAMKALLSIIEDQPISAPLFSNARLAKNIHRRWSHQVDSKENDRGRGR